MKEMLQRFYAGTISSILAGITVGTVSTTIFLLATLGMGEIQYSSMFLWNFMMMGSILTSLGIAGAFFWLLPLANLTGRINKNPKASSIFAVQGLATVLVLGTLMTLFLAEFNFHPDPTMFCGVIMTAAFAGAGMFSWWYPRLKDKQQGKRDKKTNLINSMGYVIETKDMAFETEIYHTES